MSGISVVLVKFRKDTYTVQGSVLDYYGTLFINFLYFFIHGKNRHK